jgi:hypothetical protein
MCSEKDRAPVRSHTAIPVLWRVFFLLFAAQGMAFAVGGREIWDCVSIVALAVGTAAAGVTLRYTNGPTPAIVVAIAFGLLGATLTALVSTRSLTPMAPSYGAAVVIGFAPPYSRRFIGTPRVDGVGVGAMTFALSCVLLGLEMALRPRVGHGWRGLILAALIVSGLPWLLEVRRARRKG